MYYDLQNLEMEIRLAVRSLYQTEQNVQKHRVITQKLQDCLYPDFEWRFLEPVNLKLQDLPQLPKKEFLKLCEDVLEALSEHIVRWCKREQIQLNGKLGPVIRASRKFLDKLFEFHILNQELPHKMEFPRWDTFIEHYCLIEGVKLDRREDIYIYMSHYPLVQRMDRPDIIIVRGKLTFYSDTDFGY